MNKPSVKENINDLIAAYVGHSSSENYKVLMKKIRSTIKQAQEEILSKVVLESKKAIIGSEDDGYNTACIDLKFLKEKLKKDL